MVGWRKITKEDVKRGVLIRMKSIIDDGGFGLALIISESKNDSLGYDWHHITIARPMCYANEHYGSRQPMLSAEVFEVGVNMLDASEMEVFEGNSGKLRSYTT